MARYKDDPMTAATLRRYLESQDDFGLELAIYSKALSLGLRATHGGTYEDGATGRMRQYDVRAFAVDNDCRIDLAIECKSLKTSYPLVISHIPRAQKESFHQVVWAHPRTASFIVREVGPAAKTINLELPEGFYPVGGMVGKSTSQIGLTEKGEFTTGDSEAYEKWAQALGSAAELIQAARRYGNDFGIVFKTAVIPVLVVADGTLWTAAYTQQGRLIGDPMPADHTTLYVGREYQERFGVNYVISHLHVCTKSGMERFLERIAGDKSLWSMLFPEKEIFEKATLDH